MKKTIFWTIIVIAVLVGVYFYELKQETNLGAINPVAGSTYNLAGAGISSSATSIVLQSLTIPQTGQKLVDADFGGTFYVTLEPGNKTKQEIASCTTVTQGSNSATLSGCSRGLAPITPYTASTTLQFSHAGGAQVIFSDPPQLFELYAGKSNSEVITGAWKFTVVPSSTDECVETNEFCTKTYIDNSVNQGAATATELIAGISEQATQNEMASSTQFDANNPHFMSSEYATSTPSDISSGEDHFVVVTEDDLKINQSFLDLTEAWDFSGLMTMANATVTSSFIVGNLGEAPTNTMTIIGNTHLTGNVTTTGQLFIGGPMTFNGTQYSDMPVSMEYASGSDAVIADGTYGFQDFTTRALGATDSIHIRAMARVTGSGSGNDLYLTVDGVTTTAAAAGINLSRNSAAYWDVWVQNLGATNNNMVTSVYGEQDGEAAFTSSTYSTATNTIETADGIDVRLTNIGAGDDVTGNSLIIELHKGN